jgi:predicted DNA-binding protein
VARPKSGEAMVTWATRLPQSLADSADAAAEKTGHTRAEFVRAALTAAVIFDEHAAYPLVAVAFDVRDGMINGPPPDGFSASAEQPPTSGAAKAEKPKRRAPAKGTMQPPNPPAAPKASARPPAPPKGSGQGNPRHAPGCTCLVCQ